MDAEQYVHYFGNRGLAMKPLRVWRIDCVEKPEDFLSEVQRSVTVVSAHREAPSGISSIDGSVALIPDCAELQLGEEGG